MRRIFAGMDYRYYYETLEGAPAARAKGLTRAVPAAGLAVVASAAMPALGAVDLQAAASVGVAGALVAALACAVPAALGGGRLLARYRLRVVTPSASNT